MKTSGLDLTELNTLILVLKVMTAAAWADGHMDARERKLLEQMIEKAHLSAARKASLIIAIEQPPSEAEINEILLELCQRAKIKEAKQAIIALTDKMIASDTKLEVSEIEFRERLENTLNNQGKNFFQALVSQFRS